MPKIVFVLCDFSLELFPCSSVEKIIVVQDFSGEYAVVALSDLVGVSFYFVGVNHVVVAPKSTRGVC